MTQPRSSNPDTPDSSLPNASTYPEPPDEDSVGDLPSSLSSTASSSTATIASSFSSSSSGSAQTAVPPRRVPSLRAVSDPQTTSTAKMSSTSSLSGTLSSARRPPPSADHLPLDIMQKARALQQQRAAMSPHQPGGAPGSLGDASHGGIGSNMRLPSHLNRNINIGGVGRPPAPNFPQSAPVIPSSSVRKPGPSLSERRAAMKLGPLPGGSSGISRRGAPSLKDLDKGGPAGQLNANGHVDNRMDDFKHYIDTEKGWITFEGAATITRTGVNFAGGQTFKISLDEIQVLDELGKGNYGTVYKVRHAKPAAPRFGPGLSGFKTTHVPPKSLPVTSSQKPTSGSASCTTGPSENGTPLSSDSTDCTTGKVMAMKEIRLELDEAKFSTILKELVILHECVSPYIIEFYGAFYQEGAVYMCIEYMDGGSIDKLYTGGIPEPVLQKIAYSTVMGLKTLKDKHNIIHRDVKPTNILANSRGQVKICDFGVSGNLVASIAKTNIGCQSYMAPERISGGGMTQTGGGTNTSGTYSVQSDIWSLGLTIIECAMGRYPYPPEVSSTIFSQLSAIVNGEPPDMPENYSATAHDFVRSCLNKNPVKRHTYSMLLKHPWLKSIATEGHAIEEESESGTDSDEEKAGGITKKVDGLSLPEDQDDKPDAQHHHVAGDNEVAAWVTRVLDEKKSGTLAASNAATKPALHAAPFSKNGV